MNNRIGSIPSFTGRQSLDIATGHKHTGYKCVNDYLLICELGEGSFAKVFLGFHQGKQKYYALKRVHLDGLSRTASGIRQLECEISMMRKLHHTNIISLKEVIHVPKKNVAYMVLEYADCGNLSAILESGYKFEKVEIRSIFKQIVEGVSFLHSQGIVHQDLKPSNILMKSNGTALISDFGIGHSFQCAAMVVGTPAYQAPEVIDEFCEANIGENDDPGKEDVWSLGVTLYELVFHELPFAGGNVFEIVRSIAMTEELEPPEKCDEMLWDLITRMLTVDPAQRISISEILEHEYLLDAPGKMVYNVKAFKPPEIDPEKEVKIIKGKICSPGYSFAKADESLHTRLQKCTTPFQTLFQSPFG
ncbi:CAMK family protein kinase [Tritrichomonas foetus]|uniref:CAMK family protein kinase n=1 Tax=Tritrichomonas foetus TaxID=1144522 RepID=A0A1J4K1T5_9EUKA|nr:CAMK family protein kinase [Tritrichomonas foetus]|eukprot:OHT05401.1 CAMK family protein kinase [Tritrichomonas foetus]